MNEAISAMSALEVAKQVVADRSEIEAFVQESNISSVSVSGGKVESFRSAQTRGLGVRVLDSGRFGHAYTTDLSDAGITRVIDMARDNCLASDPDEAHGLPKPESIEQLNIFDTNATQVSPERKVEIALELESKTVSYPDINGVRTASYSDSISHIAIASSEGVEAAFSRSVAQISVYAISQRNDESQTGTAFAWARHPDDLDVSRVSEEAATRASRMLGAKKVETASVPAIFTPETTVAVLGVLASQASGEAASKGQTPLLTMLDQEIGSDIVNIVDDGTAEHALGSAPFDGEGLPHRRVSIVENGVFRGFLHSFKTANKLKTQSTGNSGRVSYKTPPMVSPSSFMLLPGETNPGDMLSRISEGFLIQELIGVHSGVNPVTGQFSVGASGMWIRNGELTHGVREVTVASTIFDLLRGITEVGNDFKSVPGFLVLGAYGAPSVLVESVKVGGL